MEMECEGDKAQFYESKISSWRHHWEKSQLIRFSRNSNLHPKQSKATNHPQFSSTSMPESSLKIPILPTELITEILSRLPLKLLLQLRAHHQNPLKATGEIPPATEPAIYQDPSQISTNKKDFTHHRLKLRLFELFHPKYNLKDCSVSDLLYEGVTRAFDLDYPMKNPCNFVEIVGSVNGLICLAIEGKNLFIWNPSFRKFKKLPDFIAVVSMCDSYYMYGFGYDELDDDYKVVRGLRNLSYNNSCYIDFQIYSLNSDPWRTVDHFLSEELRIKSADGKWGKVEKPCYGEGDSDFRPLLGVLGSDLSVFYNNRKTFANLWVIYEGIWN
ncbi:hypothetical protein HAX54_020280 [Datura stramonium]|uniref:F-box associated beta-propeller type 3 domain-containing protein n=1 Tax=Datura stramonium TaxID=4076 RepID=A0ABS8S2A6_DATST|nr:hypothetical protein [Datura stramonium]